MMTKRIYVHVGLPKTATTTLQLNYFPYVDNSKYTYLGVKQPRSACESNFLFEEFIRAVREGTNIQEVRSHLQESLQSDKRSIIISEEMITVGSYRVTWQDQLFNLGRILKGFDYRILITVREPVSAMFSFYTELYSRFRKSKLPFEELCLSKNDFFIYHYDVLLEVLSNYFDIDRVYVQKFEDLINNEFDAISKFLDYPIMDLESVSLKDNNRKKRKKNGILVAKKIELLWVARIYKLLGGDEGKISSYLKSALIKPVKKIRNASFKSFQVSSLSNEQALRISREMTSSKKLLKKNFDISY